MLNFLFFFDYINFPDFWLGKVLIMKKLLKIFWGYFEVSEEAKSDLGWLQ